MPKFRINYNQTATKFKGKPADGETVEADFFEDNGPWIDFKAASPAGGDKITKLRVLAEQVDRVETISE